MMASVIAAEEGGPSAEHILEKVFGQQKMDRDVGIATLSRLVKDIKCDPKYREYVIAKIQTEVATILDDLSAGRDTMMEGASASSLAAGVTSVEDCSVVSVSADKKLGCLAVALVLLSPATAGFDASGIGGSNTTFAQKIKFSVFCFVSDEDYRIRMLAGDVYGLIAKTLGPVAFTDVKEKVYESLRKDLEVNQEIEEMIKSPETPIDPTGEVGPVEPHSVRSPQLGMSPATTNMNPEIALSTLLKEAVNSLKGLSDDVTHNHPPVATSPEAFANFGCVNLESNLKCLQHIAKGLGSKFAPCVDQRLLDLVYLTLSHFNRFVREAGFALCASIIESGIDLSIYGKQLSQELVKGLCDFCSQTRVTAAISCRKFLLGLTEKERETYYPTMLPGLCLSRYYMADTKFLLYSQESWKVLFGMNGPALVAFYINDVVSYYIEATSSDNHAIREAACACLGELSRKVDRNVIFRHVPSLLETLRKCFHDERWHVRDAACLAAGNFFLNYPTESRHQLEPMYPLFLENLEFPIAIVRQGAAAALANIVRAYGNEIIPKTFEVIVEGLSSIQTQTAETSKNVDALAISPETKYSYPPGQGSPSLPYARSSEPWERADGCLYLIGDVSQILECQSGLNGLIPNILKAAEFRSFSQHVVVLETICKVIPLLVKGIGKKPFKEFLSQFFELIFYSIESENSLTSAAGKICLQELSQIYGPNIIRSRIELIDPRFVHYVDGS